MDLHLGVAISLPWVDGGRRSRGAERDCGADEQGIPDFSRIASGFPSSKREGRNRTVHTISHVPNPKEDGRSKWCDFFFFSAQQTNVQL